MYMYMYIYTVYIIYIWSLKVCKSHILRTWSICTALCYIYIYIYKYKYNINMKNIPLLSGGEGNWLTERKVKSTKRHTGAAAEGKILLAGQCRFQRWAFR